MLTRQNLKIILITITVFLFLGSGVFFSVRLSLNSAESRLARLIDRSPEIKSRYIQNKLSLAIPALDENGVAVKIGEPDSGEFTPSLEISKWEGEAKMKITPLQKVSAESDSARGVGLRGFFSSARAAGAEGNELSFDKNKINFATPEEDFRFYDIPPDRDHKDGAYEFEVIWKEKPKSNVVELEIETENLNFYYQPALDEEPLFKKGGRGVPILNKGGRELNTPPLKKGEGQNSPPSKGEQELNTPLPKGGAGEFCTPTQCTGSSGRIVRSRPENVVGSYAVYHATRRDHILGRKNYMAGKAFHIYRPKIIDARGDWVWGEFNRDLQKTKKLIITVPQDFLDKAAYPVIVDPTFGWTTPGASTYTPTENVLSGTPFTSPADAQSANSISIYGYTNGVNVKGVLVLTSNLNIVTNGVGSAAALPSSGGWVTSTLSSNPSISPSTSYVLMNVGDGLWIFYYDDMGGGTYEYYDWSNSYASPTNPTDAESTYYRRHSIYATYTAVVGLDQEGFRFRNDDGSEATATWLMAQDVNLTQTKNTNVRLRLLVNANNDPPSTQYLLEYRKTGDSGWSTTTPETGVAIRSVTLGTDDAQQLTTTMTLTGTTIGASLDATTEWAGMRFPGVLVPKGVTITSASLSVVPSGTGEDEPLVTIYMEDADNPGTFTTGASNISNRSRTSGVSWSSADLGATGSSYHSSPDLSSIVQAVVNRSGWASGNAMVVIIQGGSDVNRDLTIESYENTGKNPPILTINFSYPASKIVMADSSNIATSASSHILDTSSAFTGTSNPLTSSYTAGSGATLMAVSLVVGGTTLRTGGAPLYNGVTMTQAGTTQGGGTGYEQSVELWYLIDPPTGSSYTISIPNSGSLTIHAIASTYKTTSVGFTSALDQATGTAATSGANPSVNLTTSGDGTVVVSVLGCGLSTGPTNQTGVILNSTVISSTRSSSGYYELREAAGAFPSTWTIATDDRAMVSAAFKPARRSTMNTTAQLSPPDGKTTSSFTAGAIRDDQNPVDAVDIADNYYTELEWNLVATGSAQNGDVYQFRITKNGTVLESYSVTPQWTIGTPGAPPGPAATATSTILGKSQANLLKDSGLVGYWSFDGPDVVSAVPSSFPATPILDNFNRANEGPPLSSQWYSYSQWKVSSNQAAIDSFDGNGNAWAFYKQYGADSEIYVTLAAKPSDPYTMIGLFLRGDFIWGYYYYAAFEPQYGTDTIYIMKVTDWAGTQISSTYYQEFNSGDSLGFRAVGSTLQVFYKPSGGSWTDITSGGITDTDVGGPGWVGFLASDYEASDFAARIDDFGGGNVKIAYDRSGSGNNGGISGNTAPVPGISGQALSFDGDYDLVYPGNVSGSIKNISYWIKPSSSRYLMQFSSYIDFSIGIERFLLNNGLYAGPTTYTRYINAVIPASESLGSELTSNGTFETGAAAPWAVGYGASLSVTTSNPYAGTYSANYNIMDEGEDYWNVQMRYDSNFSLSLGTLYKIQFAARGSTAKDDISVMLQLNADPWTQGAVAYNFDLTTSWVFHTYYVYSTISSSQMSLWFNAGDRGVFQMYLDNISVKPVNSIGDVTNDAWNFVSVNFDNSITADDFSIGSFLYWDNSGSYKGLIDEVRMYSRALSTAEILQLYNAGTAEVRADAPQSNLLNDSGLVGYWSFNGLDMDWGSSTAEVLDRSSYVVTQSGNTGQKAMGAYGDDYNQWTTPQNADSSSDNNRAREATNTERQDWYNFGFSIPSNAAITGIDVFVEASASAANSVTGTVDLSWDGGSTYSTTTSFTRNSTTDSNTTMGGSGDLWGHAWTPSELSDSNFRLRITKSGTAGTEIRVDRLLARAYYTIPIKNHGNAMNMNYQAAVRPGINGQALLFDGVDDWISTDAVISSLFSNTTVTMSAWVKAPSAATCTSTVYDCPAIATDSGGYIGIHYNLVAGVTKVLAYNFDGNVDLASINYTPGEWAHIVLVHSNGTLYGYKNGALVDSTASGNTQVMTGTLRIGKNLSSQVFPGFIDEVRIYNRALSAAEIMTLYKAGAKEMIIRN